MLKDWLFKDEHSICHFRIAAVLLRNNKLFVARDKDAYALPGGHVAYGETSEETLVREFKEEVGVEIICNRLIWVEENFWKWGSRNAHNISFYYLVSLKDDAALPEDFDEVMMDNSDVRMLWVSLDDIPHLRIYPEFIKDKIGNIAPGIEHFVRNAWDT